jgi:hypothetical protein
VPERADPDDPAATGTGPGPGTDTGSRAHAEAQQRLAVELQATLDELERRLPDARRAQEHRQHPAALIESARQRLTGAVRRRLGARR